MPQGNLLIGTRVGVGKVAINIRDTAISQDLTAAIIDNSAVDREFLAYAIKWDKTQDAFLASMRGTTIKGIPRADLVRIPIPLPPLPEQRRIAAVLNAIQDAIAAQEDVIAEARALKRSLMQRLFTYGPGREPAETKETEIGEIPVHWELTPIREMGTVVTGTTPSTKRSDYYGDEYPFIRPGDMGEGKYIPRTEKQLSLQGLEAGRELPKDSVLEVCIGATIGKVGLTTRARSATNQQINTVICNSRLNPHFLYYSLLFHAGYIRTFAAGGPVPILSKRNFEEILIPLALCNEQDVVAARLSTLDDKIAAEEDRKAALQDLFKAALHQLMTGQVRLLSN